jgi:hypothetical protein
LKYEQQGKPCCGRYINNINRKNKAALYIRGSKGSTDKKEAEELSVQVD